MIFADFHKHLLHVWVPRGHKLGRGSCMSMLSGKSRLSKLTVSLVFICVVAGLSLGAAYTSSGAALFGNIKAFLSTEATSPASDATPRRTTAPKLAKNDLVTAAYSPAVNPFSLQN